MILITGASRGIGKYLFDKFISEGEKVYGTYLRDSEEYSVNEKEYSIPHKKKKK